MVGRPMKAIYVVLERFMHQFFQWIYIDRFSLVLTTQLFNQLFEELFHASGLALQVDYNQWVTRKDKWDKKWNISKNGRPSLMVMEELSELPLWYEGTTPVLDLQSAIIRSTPSPLVTRYSQARQKALQDSEDAGDPRGVDTNAGVGENPHHTTSTFLPIRSVRAIVPKPWDSGITAEDLPTSYPQQTSPYDASSNFPGPLSPYEEYPLPVRLIHSTYQPHQVPLSPRDVVPSNAAPFDHTSTGAAAREAEKKPAILLPSSRRKRTQTDSFPAPPAARRKGRTAPKPAGNDSSLQNKNGR